MLQYTIGHLPSEHLHVWATCTTGHLPYWATFNCAIKIRNYHIIKLRVWRITYILYWYYVNGRRKWAGHCICQLHGGYICRQWRPCIHPICGHRSQIPTKIMFRASRTQQLSPFTRTWSSFSTAQAQTCICSLSSYFNCRKKRMSTCRACMYLSWMEYVELMAFKHLLIDSSDTDT